MTNGRRRLIFAGLVAVLVLPLELTLMPSLFSAATGPVAPGEWASLHALEFSQSTLDIKTLPLAYRKAVFAALPSEKRGELWRAHFTEYVALHNGELSETQLAILDDATELVALHHIQGAPQDQVAALATGILTRAKASFSLSETAALFYDFGPRETPFPSTGLSIASLRTAFWGAVLHARMAPDCTCSTGDPWCGNPVGGMACDENRGGCAHDEDWPACGGFWLFECNGMCPYDIITTP